MSKDLFDTIAENWDFIEARCKECRAPFAWRKTKLKHEEQVALKSRLNAVGFTCEGCVNRQKAIAAIEAERTAS